MDRKSLLVVILVALLGGLALMRLGANRQNETASVPVEQPPTSAAVFSDEQFATRESIDSTINAETDQIDKDLKAMNDSEFDASGLSQTQLEK